MLKRFFVLLMLGATPVFGAIINYDYEFIYYDVTDCATGCSPTGSTGQGNLIADTDEMTLLELNLLSAEFDLQWQGVQSFEVRDIWDSPEGALVSLGTEVRDPNYVATLFFDLFPVPGDGANPLWYLDGVTEQYNTLSDGISDWELYGEFTGPFPVNGPSAAAVPEPASWLLFAAGLLAVAGAGGRSRALRQQLSSPL